MMIDWGLYFEAGLLIWVIVTAVWIYSLAVRDASVMDIFWGPGFILVSALFALGAENPTGRSLLVLWLVVAWGVRLAVYIGKRNHSKPEDERYRQWRIRGGTSWWWKSYFKVFLLQGAVMWLVSLTLFYPLVSRYPAGLNLLDWLGLAVWTAGFLFEAVADYQLMKFKRVPANGDKLFSGGLWSVSRHPNYFGESMLWWGFGLLSLAVGGWLGVAGPLLMTFLLLKVSGVTLLEKTMSADKPGLEEYRRSTPAFFPWGLFKGWWRKALFLLAALLFVLPAAVQFRFGAPPDLSDGFPVPEVDLGRYAGDWYVVAGRTTLFERNSFNPVESYRMLPGGTIGIEYTARRGGPEGERMSLRGTGFPQPEAGGAYWTVGFFGPLKFTYLVVYLDADYSRAVVVSAGGQHMWVLSREPSLEPEELKAILRRIESVGYDTDSVRKIPQPGEPGGETYKPSGRSFA